MAMRNGHQIVGKMKQVQPCYSASLAHVGKTSTGDLSVKMAKSLVKLASESSSRRNVAESVPFFAFNSTLVEVNGRGQIKLARGVNRKIPPIKVKEMKKLSTPRVAAVNPSVNTKRLRTLLKMKIRTPRSLMSNQNEVRRTFQEAKLPNSLKWSFGEDFQTDSLQKMLQNLTFSTNTFSRNPTVRF